MELCVAIKNGKDCWVQWLMPIKPDTMGGVYRRILVQVSQGKNTRPYLKNSYTKKG
jgi:hypothetical protein